MTGLHRGSLVAAGTALAGALVALAFVPARAGRRAKSDLRPERKRPAPSPSMTRSDA